MKLFLSWSGKRSHQVAQLFEKWIKVVIQSVEPWLSSKDIDKGTIWFDEITSQLNTTENGIFFLTKSNLTSPWLLFEAGAISKGSGKNNILTFLIDVKTDDVGQPLSQFNNIRFNKDDIFHLLKTINKKLDKSLDDDVLTKVFEINWKSFDEGFKKIIETSKEENIETIRDEYDILSEVLGTVRSVDKFMSKLNHNYKIVKMGSYLVNNSEIPIKWDLDSYKLTDEGKKIIDKHLLPILKLGHKVVISSHTNSKGKRVDNVLLTNERAKKIKDYVVKKHKINPDNIEVYGYGSTRLTNRCSQGVPCTEEEHNANIRTTFRIVNNFIE